VQCGPLSSGLVPVQDRRKLWIGQLTKMDIDDQTVLERAASPPELRISDDETVLLDIDGGRYFTLMGKVSVRIWQMLAIPQSTEALVEGLVEEFEVDRGHCHDETRQFLDVLVARQLVRRVARP